MTPFDGPIATATSVLTNLSVGELVERVQAALATFTSATRLYDVAIEGVSAPLTVEAFQASQGVSCINDMTVLLLSTDAHLPVENWLLHPCQLRLRLADGSDHAVSGLIRAAHCLSSEGGLARYQVSVVSWWWQLTQQSRSRVFQDKTVLQIVDQVLLGVAHAHWQLSAEVSDYVAQLPNCIRPYTVQYRESDWAFITRLLGEVGIGLCADEADDAPGGSLRLFANSRQWPENLSSKSDQGIRFHRGHSQESADAIQAVGERWQRISAASTTLSYQPLSKRAVTAAQGSTQLADGTSLGLTGPSAQQEHYRYSTRHASSAQADFAMRLARQAAEAQARQWVGRGTVRSLRAGEWFALTHSPLEGRLGNAGTRPELAVLALEQLGINNLPTPTQQCLSVLFGSAVEVLGDDLGGYAEPDPSAGRTQGIRTQGITFPLPLHHDDEVIQHAQRTGFACRFVALHREQVWTAPYHSKPASPGPLTARVTGPGGALTPTGTDELWLDALGRVQVRFHWQRGEQPDDTHTVWLRVKQQQAGPGFGLNVLPRIGHEVWVDFVQGDIECPIVMGSVYNGRGEQAEESLGRSRNHAPAAQANLTGGHSPAWHAAGGSAQRHAGSLMGFKDAELGSMNGFNQLALDDSDNQLRTQLRTTHLGSEVNLGHVIHAADNHRGSVKGAGVELRTDGYVSLRGAQGVVLSTFADSKAHTTTASSELTPALALAKQADGLLGTFAQAAKTHRALSPAAQIGSQATNRSVLNDRQAPWPAVQVSLKGMVSPTHFEAALKDATLRNTQVKAKHIPHLADPLIVTAAQAQHVSVTGQSQIDAVGDSLHRATGGDYVSVQGSHALTHTGQALSVLSGVIGPGPNNLGLQAIAATDALTLQAQAGTMNLVSQQQLKVASKDNNVTVAAPQAIHLTTQAGARLSLVNGNIEVHAPGTISLLRASSQQLGPESVSMAMNQMPKTQMQFDDSYILRNATNGHPLKNRKFILVRSDGARINGTTDATGKTGLQQSLFFEALQVILPKND